LPFPPFPFPIPEKGDLIFPFPILDGALLFPLDLGDFSSLHEKCVSEGCEEGVSEGLEIGLFVGCEEGIIDGTIDGIKEG
jgi:hypothetical protein